MKGDPEICLRKALSRIALSFWTPIRIKARWQQQMELHASDRDFSVQIIIK
jgi:hypothetical protein